MDNLRAEPKYMSDTRRWLYRWGGKQVGIIEVS